MQLTFWQSAVSRLEMSPVLVVSKKPIYQAHKDIKNETNCIVLSVSRSDEQTTADIELCKTV